ncbi:hypothetical protein M422DRAFT_25298 [Sphaerobolus stellatus SS14]|nr:hypothetical protein M422DRAFT_25298 [Sphaerobolus stellatus SS14]
MDSSTGVIQDIASLKALAIALFSSKYSLLGAYTVLVYDISLMFSDEMKYIWRREWSSVKRLYMVNRYLALLIQTIDIGIQFTEGHSQRVCQHYWLYRFALTITVLIMGASILTIRVHAVYRKNWKITGPIYAVIILCASICAALVYMSELEANSPDPPLPGCYIQSFKHPFFIINAWILPLVGESVLSSAMVYKAWELWRTKQNSVLLTNIVYDSLIYYISIFVLLVTNFLIWQTQPVNFYLLIVPWLQITPCVLGGRLLINMRQRYRDETLASVDQTETSTYGRFKRPVQEEYELQKYMPASSLPRDLYTGSSIYLPGSD